MPGEMLVISNPRGRKKARRRARTRTKRTRARSRAVVTVRANPVRRRRRRNPVAVNPRRRRSRSIARISRRRRRNPITGRGLISQLTSSIMPAIQGAAGAIALNAVYNRIPLPAMLKTGPMGTITKAAMAVGLGMLVSRFGGRELGKNMASGALTVLAYNQIQPMLPAGLSDVGYYGAGYALDDLPHSFNDIPSTLSEYISDTDQYDGVGEYISN